MFSLPAAWTHAVLLPVKPLRARIAAESWSVGLGKASVLYVNGQLGGYALPLLLDTGSDNTFVNTSLYESLGPDKPDLEPV